MGQIVYRILEIMLCRVAEVYMTFIRRDCVVTEVSDNVREEIGDAERKN